MTVCGVAMATAVKMAVAVSQQVDKMQLPIVQ